ncbi:MAG: peptidylprolyl isomerase [Oxalobacter sp.]
MKKSFVLGALAVALMSVTASAKDIATVNGKGIPESKSDAVVKNFVARGAKDTPELRKGIREELITDEVMVQEAEKQGLANTTEFKNELDTARRGMLKQSLAQEYLKKNPVSDKDVKTQYDQWSAANKGKQYHAKHILVKTEAEAKDIISQLGKGGNFERLASSKSLDGSKTNGGDLGWSPATGYVKPFADAMMALGKGQITKTPVQSPFGFHVIKLVDSKALPTYDQMKSRFKADMEQARFGRYVRSLREKAKVE